MSGFEAVFGIVTGGAGLVSLGLQLGDCARRLHKMYNSSKDAPNSLDRFAFDLETMAMCLHMLDQRRQHHSQNPAADILIRCITACQQATNEIQQLVDKMARRLEEHARMRGRLYFVFKEQDIQELLNSLERAKSSIQFAYTMYLAEEQRQRDEAHSSLLVLQGQVLDGLQKQITSESIGVAQQLTLLSRSNRKVTDPQPTVDNSKPLSHSKSRMTAKSKKASWRTRLRLSQPFCRRIWDAAITINQFGWNFDLRTYNVVPYWSPIFYFCAVGDLATVQHLLQVGEAGLLDVRIDDDARDANGYMTLIEYAAQAGQLHVCQYLLDQATWPDHSAVLNRALGLYSCSYDYNTTSEAYRLFIEAPGFNSIVDILDGETRCEWLERCHDPHSFDVILQNIPFEVFSGGSIQTRFEIAMKAGKVSASEFLKCLGTHASGPELACLRTKYSERSVLHYIARRLRDLVYIHSQKQAVNEWVEFGVAVLKSGADPSSVAKRQINHSLAYWQTRFIMPQWDLTPLLDAVHVSNWDMVFGDGWWVRDILKIIRIWAGMVQQAGIDLCQYGAKESEVWKSLPKPKPGTLITKWTLSELVYGPTPEQWSLKVLRRDWGISPLGLQIYELKRVPGSFPKSHVLPTKIIWRPTPKEQAEGPWVIMGHWPVPSQPIDLREAVSSLEFREPFIEIIEDIQDDHGHISIMQYRARAKGRAQRSRSHSQPPPLSLRAGSLFGDYRQRYKGFEREWFSKYRCSVTSKLELQPCCCSGNGSLFDPRSCVKGGANGPSSVQESKRWEYFSFLADIALCQDNHPNPMRRIRKGHTGAADCPWNCRAVNLDELNVPKTMEPYHPMAYCRYEEYKVT